MEVIESEFFREGLPHSNQAWMTLVFDAKKGELIIRRYRTEKFGTRIESEQESLASYLANSKPTKAKRALAARLRSIALAIRDT